jgi:outer membrane protein assembly factor BamB
MSIGTQRLRRTCLAAALLLAAPQAGRAGDQPQWGRRYSRNMVSDEKNLLVSFDPATGRNVVWTARLGSQTNASPIVAGGKVLVGTNNDQPRDDRHRGDRGVLMCFRQADGRFLWQLVVPKLSDAFADWHRVGISSPPTVEGSRAYLVSSRGEVLCLDLEGLGNGNDGPFRDEGRHMAAPGKPALPLRDTDADIVWIYDMRNTLGVLQHNAANGSVLLHGPYLYVSTSNGVDHTHRRVPAPDAPSLIVLDKTTGRLVAADNCRMGPQIFHGTWSSPALGEVAGRARIFFGGGDGVCYAFEALAASPAARGRAGGKPGVLRTAWRFHCDPANRSDDPHAFHNNRREGPSNIIGMPVYHNERVYVAAGGDICHGKRAAWMKCIDATKTGDITAAGEIWSYPMKHHCIATPAIADGLVYFGDCSGRIHCVDAETGRACWVHRTRGAIWGSALLADGKVYVGTQRGELCVLAHGRAQKELARVQLPAGINTTPTAADGVLYVATRKTLYAVRQAAGDPPAGKPAP